VLNRLIETNELEGSIKKEYEVKVVHNDNYAMFMNLDNNFFVSFAILKAADMKEEELALLISHELSHYLLDH
jgi:predicted Zn-dependent protease